ncbi:MAG: DUF4271 domain-containing protein [Bacteroidia bacterium]
MKLMLLDLMLREQTPLVSRISLLSLLVIIGLLFSVNHHWFRSLKLLSLLPFQRFGWQSEKYGSDTILRISSFITLSIAVAIAIQGYSLGPTAFSSLNVYWILGVIILLFMFNLLANKMYFSLHESSKLGEQIIDYQYSVNQWYAILLTGLLLLDFFFLKQASSILYIIGVITGLYFLSRLFGTIIIFQNNFKYPLLTVFVYLCTFEIVPAIVMVKVLFVNS